RADRQLPTGDLAAGEGIRRALVLLGRQAPRPAREIGGVALRERHLALDRALDRPVGPRGVDVVEVRVDARRRRVGGRGSRRRWGGARLREREERVVVVLRRLAAEELRVRLVEWTEAER